MEKVAIIGIGRSSSPDLSFKELIFDAAVRAYDDAGIDPEKMLIHLFHARKITGRDSASSMNSPLISLELF